jgi:hypothetical protein
VDLSLGFGLLTGSAPRPNFVTLDFVTLDFVTFEEFVFFAAATVGALQARNKQHCHAYRHHHGKNTSIHRDPMHEVLHLSTIIPER